MNEEQTASLKTALFHGHSGLVCGPRCEPLSGAEARGCESACANSDRPKGRSSAMPRPARLIPCRVDVDDLSHQGLVELARCRSELSFHLLACCLLRDGFVARYAAVAACIGVAPPGLTLTCRASKASPLVITAHRMRAFLLASATAAFCQPARSVNGVTGNGVRSCPLPSYPPPTASATAINQPMRDIARSMTWSFAVSMRPA